MNTGDNRTGDVVGWDNIAPGADGSFILVSSQYLGPAPGNAQPGPLAYAPVAVRLEEIGGPAAGADHRRRPTATWSKARPTWRSPPSPAR